MLARLARSSYRHRRLVVLAWILLLTGTVAVSSLVAGRTATSGRLPGTDSDRALQILKRQFPQRSGDAGAIVFGNLPGRQPAVDAYLEAVARVPA